MTRLWLYIPRYRWMVTIYYGATRADAEEVMGHLLMLGVSGEDALHSWLNLTDGMPDEGITFSAGRRSVVVIGKASSTAEYANTIDHELNHLKEHIADGVGIDLRGEEIAYLRGELSRDTHHVNQKYICSCDNG